ncbi:stonustoxin subunit beta-like [Gouania willdenowi]|uniref:Stonustoxin subunit beta-like n=1 Tax=Gouania willdenowi TaxID=441366 RepID=A0A8C5EJJ3_GOUWI|nr:stonustoxin subunit beta-like [Gouania willdenowi]
MMPTTNRIISDTQKSDKAKKAKAVDVLEERAKAYVPNIPEPTCRADLVKHWINLTFDDKTANKVLWITEGGAKVARMTDDLTCPVLDRAERYEYSPQVLCKEGILGFRAYWEVDYTGWVIVGVAYEKAGRRNIEGSCGLGENEESWALGWSGSSYNFWHNGESEEIKNLPRCPTIGVYLDQPAGILKFYGVMEKTEGDEASEGKEVTLLQEIRSTFHQKIIPGLWMGPHSHCMVLKMEE